MKRKKYSSNCKGVLFEQDRINIVDYFKSKRVSSLTEVIRELNLSIQKSGLSKFLKKQNLFLYNPKNKNSLTAAQKKNRFIWAAGRETWGKEDWQMVAFTDETTITNKPYNYKVTALCEKSAKREAINVINTKQVKVNIRIFIYFTYIFIKK